MKLKVNCTCSIVAFMALLPVAVDAKEWFVQPTAKLHTEVDDNIQLVPTNATEAYGFVASMQTKGGVQNDKYSATLGGGVDVYQYWGQRGLDRNNFNLNLDTSYSVSEKHKVGLVAGYISDTSLTSEGASTGLFIGNVGRESINVAPSWSYILSESQILKATYTHEDVSYAASKYNFLSSYQTDSGSLGYTLQWSPAWKYFASVGGMHYQLANYGTSIDNYNLNLGFDYKYSETLSFNFMVGGRYTQNQSQSQTLAFNPAATQASELFTPRITSLSSSALGSLFSIGVEKNYEVGRVKFDYSRSANPTGVGVFIQSDNINANAEYKFTERFKVLLDSTLGFYGSTSSSNKSYNRDYYMVEPKLGWEFNRQTNIVGGYRYRSQEYTASNLSGESNSFFVYINYQWDKIASNAF